MFSRETEHIILILNLTSLGMEATIYPISGKTREHAKHFTTEVFCVLCFCCLSTSCQGRLYIYNVYPGFSKPFDTAVPRKNRIHTLESYTAYEATYISGLQTFYVIEI